MQSTTSGFIEKVNKTPFLGHHVQIEFMKGGLRLLEAARSLCVNACCKDIVAYSVQAVRHQEARK